MGSGKFSIFQAVILGIFGAFAAVGLLFFAGVGGLGSSSESVGPVDIWGTLDDGAFNTVVSQFAENDPRLAGVVYERLREDEFNRELTNALASGRGPDMFLLEQQYIVLHRDKLLPIPYDTMSFQEFRDTFISEAELYLTAQGALGIPLAVDPLVMYWNKDTLSKHGFVGAPRYWDEVFEMAEEITERDDSGGIVKSTLAFGEYSNVDYAKDILSTLILQAGGQITETDDRGELRPSLSARAGEALQPAQSALRFYTEFANPSKTVYTWNRSLSSSREAFVAGDLAMYVGYASEYDLVRSLNPNLDFGVSKLAQIRGSDRDVTYGRMYALSIPRAAANPQGALTVAFVLAGADVSATLAEARGTPSPHRGVLAQPADGADSVFRASAIIADAWLDPSPDETEQIFRGMIEDVTSGARRLSEAVQQGQKELNNVLGL